jgi:hypothetical protein
MLFESVIPGQVSFSYREIDHPEILSLIKNDLPKSGVLKRDNIEPYYYLKIEDDYILKTFPLLKATNIVMPNYFPPANEAGAHISFIYSEEARKNLEIKELNQTFAFEVTGLISIEVFGTEFYALIVTSPELEALRIRYGLATRLNYHGLWVPFHITIGVRGQ